MDTSVGKLLYYIGNTMSSPLGGHHTVINESELIFIDENINIAKLSTDRKVTITSEDFFPQCLYWSPSTENLLVGMFKYDREPE